MDEHRRKIFQIFIVQMIICFICASICTFLMYDKQEEKQLIPEDEIKFFVKIIFSIYMFFILGYLAFVLIGEVKYTTPYKEIILVMETLSIGVAIVLLFKVSQFSYKCHIIYQLIYTIQFAGATLIGIFAPIDFTKRGRTNKYLWIAFIISVILNIVLRLPLLDIIIYIIILWYYACALQKIIGGKTEEYDINDDAVIYLAVRLFFNMILLITFTPGIFLLSFCNEKVDDRHITVTII